MKILVIVFLLWVLAVNYSLTSAAESQKSDSLINAPWLSVWCNIFDISHPDYTSLSIAYSLAGLEASWNQCAADSISLFALLMPFNRQYYSPILKAGIIFIHHRVIPIYGAGILFSPIEYLIIGAGWDNAKRIYFSLGFSCALGT